MINGQMAEAQKGYAVLKDVDKGTFERYMQWAYKGYYKAADFEIETISPPPLVTSTIEEEHETTTCVHKEVLVTPPVLAPPYGVEPLFRLIPPVPEESPVPEEAQVDLDWRPIQRVKRERKKRVTAKTSQDLKEIFLQREYTVRRDVISIPPTRANRGEHENYIEVFLSHVRLYVLAEKYDIEALGTLALEELHTILAIYTLYRCRTRDIIALLRYVYANTRVPEEGGEELRMLVRDYMGYEMAVLMQDEEFKELMVEDGGAMLGDFMDMVAERIN
jgi:hypothetical protein